MKTNKEIKKEITAELKEAGYNSRKRGRSRSGTIDSIVAQADNVVAQEHKKNLLR